MATASPKIPPMPTQDIPIIDPATGRLTIPWWEYLRALDSIMRIVRSEIP